MAIAVSGIQVSIGTRPATPGANTGDTYNASPGPMKVSGDSIALRCGCTVMPAYPTDTFLSTSNSDSPRPDLSVFVCQRLSVVGNYCASLCIVMRHQAATLAFVSSIHRCPARVSISSGRRRGEVTY